MAGERILIIEDAEGVRKLLRTSLAAAGFATRFAGSGEEGLESVRRDPPDLIVLDLNLPAMDGLEVCERLKADGRSRAIPVLMLTGRGEDADVIRGLEMGADDYMVKPFSPRVLVARLRAVLRRRNEEEGPSSPVLLDDLLIDTATGEVRRGDEILRLSHPELRFLHLLALAGVAPNGPGDGRSPLPNAAETLIPSSQLLEQEGMTLFALNRLGQLAPHLVRMPDALLRQHPWLAFFSGLARLQVLKGDFHGALDAAREGFVAAGDSRGELLATVQLLLAQILFPGESTQDASLLARAMELVQEQLPQLCSYAQIQVAQCLALADLYGCGDAAALTRYQELALSLAEQQSLAGVGAIAYFCNGFQALRRGNLKGLLRLLERADPLLQNAQSSIWERILLRLLQLYALLLQGDEVNRQRLTALMDAKFDLQLLERSLPRAELGLHQVVASALGAQPGPRGEGYRYWLNEAPPFFRHRFLALGALAAWRSGQPEEAIPMLAAARPLVAACRDPFDRAWCGMLLGAVELLLGGSGQGDLLPALAAARELDNAWLEAAIAGVLLACERQEGGEIGTALAAWLTALARDGSLVLRCVPPEIRQRLLDAALDRTLAEAADPLAASLGLVIRNREEPLPLLEVQTLGGIALTMAGRTVVRAEELSPAQRELLAVLVAVPEMKLSQEEVQLDFWPDSPADKARSSFDSLLLRLRKTLDAALAPHSAKDYLPLQKGILGLENVRVDAHTFAFQIRLGLDLVRRRESWQAGNAFARAQALWKGSFMPGASARDHAADYREELDLLYVVGMQSWAALLLDTGQTQAAEEILLQALRIDRINDLLVKTLCRCYLRSNNPIKARQAIQHYAEALRRENYTRQEIEQIIATFPTLVGSSSS